MTRLQKKCLVGAAGTHLLIIVALLCSGFIKPRPKVEQADILTAIPANIVEHALNTGVQNAPPPAPTPPTPTPPTPAPPVPTPPTPTVTPPPVPVPLPITRSVEPVQPVEQPPEKPDIIPTPVKPPKLTKPAPPKIVPDLTPVVRSSTQTPDTSAEQRREVQRQERLERQERERREKVVQTAINSIEDHTSSSEHISMPNGNSPAAVANYASIVKTVYTAAWNPPDDAQNDEANVKVRVTIERNGSVSAARIIGPSGDSGLDQSVRHTLDRITTLEPFPDGMTESEHTYTINFNLKAKRQSE